MRMVRNSKSILKLQIEEQELVSKNDKRFYVGKTEADLHYFQQVGAVALFISKNAPILDPNYLHLTLVVPGNLKIKSSSWRIVR